MYDNPHRRCHRVEFFSPGLPWRYSLPETAFNSVGLKGRLIFCGSLEMTGALYFCLVIFTPQSSLNLPYSIGFPNRVTFEGVGLPVCCGDVWPPRLLLYLHITILFFSKSPRLLINRAIFSARFIERSSFEQARSCNTGIIFCGSCYEMRHRMLAGLCDTGP